MQDLAELSLILRNDILKKNDTSFTVRQVPLAHAFKSMLYKDMFVSLFHGYCTDSCSSSSYCSLVTP